MHVASLVLSAAALAAAAPSGMDKRASACTFTTAAAAIAGKAKCTTITLNNIVVPAGQTLDLTKLTTGTTVIFSGTTSFGYKEWEGPLISVSGTKITVQGASGHVIDGQGAKWWDTKGSNGGKTKPKFFYAHDLKQSSITGLNVKNTPVQGFSINSSQDLTLTGITIDNSAGTSQGHNTDAFDIGSSTGITITGANVKNQDDCLAINSGENIIFTKGTCSGGHGLSIGSVGNRELNTVKNVTISHSTISNSQNGVRIKAIYNAKGSIADVTYSDITLSNISKYGIVIEQDYQNGSPTGTATSGVPITDLKIERITGTITSSAKDMYVLCGKGACSNWTWTGNSITGGKAATCSNQPSNVKC